MVIAMATGILRELERSKDHYGAGCAEAKLALLTGDPHYRKAFYWGAFQVYIGAAPR